jgi:hypothetical protein
LHVLAPRARLPLPDGGRGREHGGPRDFVYFTQIVRYGFSKKERETKVKSSIEAFKHGPNAPRKPSRLTGVNLILF